MKHKSAIAAGPWRSAMLLALLAWAASARCAYGGADGATIVNDVTQLNPIAVSRVIVPHSNAEIIQAVKGAKGPVSIGGGRFSMGGQTATEGAVQLDMREFNRIFRSTRSAAKSPCRAG